MGQFGTDYNTRAAVAKVGLGANLPADATYPSTRLDAQGKPLDGSQRYRLHFKAGELPPVVAFWSVDTADGVDAARVKPFPGVLFKHGGHPVLVSRKVAGYVDSWNTPPDPGCTVVGMMR